MTTPDITPDEAHWIAIAIEGMRDQTDRRIESLANVGDHFSEDVMDLIDLSARWGQLQIKFPPPMIALEGDEDND